MINKFIYKVEKELISKELANIVYLYLLKKRKVAKYLLDNNWISEFETQWGYWDDKQVPDTYAHYADMLTETILEMVKPKVEQLIDKKLIETYSFGRIYKKGDILKRHKDRDSCEISCTMNIGGDKWPIYVEPTGKGEVFFNEENEPYDYKPSDEPGIKVELEPGDCLLYRGCELEHWREAFEGKDCGQVFFHYKEILNDKIEQSKYDNRPFLGLPSWVKSS
tara:strand:- start:4 stop:669 length:666 start_codon:yes stop_codon:yes gene_type:complete